MRYWAAFSSIFLIAIAISGLARADYTDGVRAYENGDYVTELLKFREVADTGDARA